MRQVCDLIARVAPTSATVLLAGESGVGKEMAARTIHDFSRRRHGPFMPVNCGAITPTLMESELFGHERGSFTGAERRHRGYFERASRGTLFLDEITEMPIELQVKLLRVLETGSLTRTGGEESVKVDLRIIAATNRNPDEAVRAGKLREDLYYRLKVFQVTLPPLRDRPDDVEPLVRHFLVQIAAAEGVEKRAAPDALAVLRRYPWPGNVRELKNVIYSAYIMANTEITAGCLPLEVASDEPPRGFDGSSLHLRVGMTMAEAERRLILATLNHLGNNKTRTAEVLGISAKTLYNRLNEYRQQAAGGAAPIATPPADDDEPLAEPGVVGPV
jgi:DNA-binding NtrC family response regulator